MLGGTNEFGGFGMDSADLGLPSFDNFRAPPAGLSKPGRADRLAPALSCRPVSLRVRRG
jgi:hypothetical protein